MTSLDISNWTTAEVNGHVTSEKQVFHRCHPLTVNTAQVAGTSMDQSNEQPVARRTPQRLQLRPWSTMECSKPAAWTTNRSLLVVPRVESFPGRPTNSCSTIPRAAHLDDDVIGCYQYITSHSGNAPASPDMRLAPWALSRMHTTNHLHHCPQPTHHSND